MTAQQRKLYFHELVRNGRAESLCSLIRDLSAYGQTRSLNDNDQALLKRSRDALLEEWAFAYSITPAQADVELHRLLPPASAKAARK